MHKSSSAALFASIYSARYPWYTPLYNRAWFGIAFQTRWEPQLPQRQEQHSPLLVSAITEQVIGDTRWCLKLTILYRLYLIELLKRMNKLDAPLFKLLFTLATFWQLYTYTIDLVYDRQLGERYLRLPVAPNCSYCNNFARVSTGMTIDILLS